MLWKIQSIITFIGHFPPVYLFFSLRATNVVSLMRIVE